MQSVSFFSWNERADYFQSPRYFPVLYCSILSVALVGILPILASVAFATDPVAPTPRATAVASAKAIKSFAMAPSVPPRTEAQDFSHLISRRTSIRNCGSLLGADSGQVATGSCELRLIELQ